MELKRERVIAHGMTLDQLADYQLSQQLNEEIEMIEGNGEGNYSLPYVERDIMHVELEARHFETSSGEKLSRPKVVKYNVIQYESMLKREYFKGYTVRVLHDGKLQMEEERQKTRKAASLPVKPQLDEVEELDKAAIEAAKKPKKL